MKLRWFLIPLVVGVLALGISGGVVLAEAGGTSTDSPIKSFASRVATILGLDETKVQDAMNQAATQLQDEGLQRKLDAMVKQGRITQEQADQLKQWYQSRPKVLSPGGPLGGFGGFGEHGFHGRGMWGFGGHGMRPMPAAPTPGTTGTTS